MSQVLQLYWGGNPTFFIKDAIASQNTLVGRVPPLILRDCNVLVRWLRLCFYTTLLSKRLQSPCFSTNKALSEEEGLVFGGSIAQDCQHLATELARKGRKSTTSIYFPFFLEDIF